MYYALFVEIRRRHFNPGSFCRKSVHTAKSVLGKFAGGRSTLRERMQLKSFLFFSEVLANLFFNATSYCIPGEATF